MSAEVMDMVCFVAMGVIDGLMFMTVTMRMFVFVNVFMSVAVGVFMRMAVIGAVFVGVPMLVVMGVFMIVNMFVLMLVFMFVVVIFIFADGGLSQINGDEVNRAMANAAFCDQAVGHVLHLADLAF